MSKNTTQRLPGEFELHTIDCGDTAVRGSLAHYYAIGGDKSGDGIFQGQILRKENGWTILKDVTVRFTDMDINYCFEDVVGTEDHVWIYDDFVYNNFDCNDCIQFNAKAYAYRRNPKKHGGQESYDFSLKELEHIKQIDGYEFPPADYKAKQEKWHQNQLEELVCSVMCMYKEQCYNNGICLAPDGWKEDMLNQLKAIEHTMA